MICKHSLIIIIKNGTNSHNRKALVWSTPRNLHQKIYFSLFISLSLVKAVLCEAMKAVWIVPAGFRRALNQTNYFLCVMQAANPQTCFVSGLYDSLSLHFPHASHKATPHNYYYYVFSWLIRKFQRKLALAQHITLHRTWKLFETEIHPSSPHSATAQHILFDHICSICRVVHFCRQASVQSQCHWRRWWRCSRVKWLHCLLASFGIEYKSAGVSGEWHDECILRRRRRRRHFRILLFLFSVRNVEIIMMIVSEKCRLLGVGVVHIFVNKISQHFLEFSEWFMVKHSTHSRTRSLRECQHLVRQGECRRRAKTLRFQFVWKTSLAAFSCSEFSNFSASGMECSCDIWDTSQADCKHKFCYKSSAFIQLHATKCNQ